MTDKSKAIMLIEARNDAERALHELLLLSALLESASAADELLLDGASADGLDAIITRAAMDIQRILDVTAPMPNGAERAESVEA